MGIQEIKFFCTGKLYTRKQRRKNSIDLKGISEEMKQTKAH